MDEERRNIRIARQQPREVAEQEKKERIPLWLAACLVLTAAFIDGLQALLTFVGIGVFLSPVISVGADFLFWLWFQMVGVSFTKNPKKLAVFGIQSLLEIIPGFDAIPILTLGILTTVIMTRSEDKGGIISKVA